MIIGAGLVGSSLMSLNAEDARIFASGVSNSQETRPESFIRERTLVESCLGERGDSDFIYISTCSVHDKTQVASPYVLHKQQMEQLVLAEKRSSILRLPNLVGPTGNKNNLVNHIVDAIISNEAVFVQESAKRYLLGVDEMASLIGTYVSDGPIAGSIVEFVPPSSTAVVDLVGVIENVTRVKAKIRIIPGGSAYVIDHSDTAYYAKKSGIVFGNDYTLSTLRKWLPNEN
jgi:nucleoside-diphosphate-sugar epimerase